MPSPEVAALREIARRAALEGGRAIAEAWERAPEGDGPGDWAGAIGVQAKSAGDYVTGVDRAAEEAIRSLLTRETPDVPAVGEEGGGEAAERHWLVDPLDGTTNFVHRFPVVGVSVALMEAGRPVVGCVHAPILGTTWTAARGFGAEQDGRPIRVSDRGPDQALVGTGFPFRRKDRLPEYEPAFRAAIRRFEDLRRAGAVALDLAWVASGAFDGFFELALAPWDLAAAALLIEEAGGVVTDWKGGDGWLGGDILAGNPRVHGELLEMVERAASAGRHP